MKLLVSGFGPFGEVRDNPSARLARSIDGEKTQGVHIIGREMPVSYHRSVRCCIDWVKELDVDVVIGVGVAVSRDVVTVERTGVRPLEVVEADVDGLATFESLQDAPAQVHATIDVDQFALHLDAVVGDDAGRNAGADRQRRGCQGAFRAGQGAAAGCARLHAKRDSRA